MAPTIARALTIAGSDSGGGAGIQADLKTFQELEVFGMSALTAVTAQNTLGVQGIYELPPQAVAEQIDAVVEDLGVDAAKTGMIANIEIMEVIAEKVKAYAIPNLVVDPVMISKSGHSLLNEDARLALKRYLLPLATVVTPNIPEAEVLTGLQLDSMEARKEAARMIIGMGARSVVIKGGHLPDGEAEDLFYDGQEFSILSSPRFETPHTHGTGCTFSAAIAAHLAKGEAVLSAVRQAKAFITAAIRHPLHLGGGHGPTNHWAHRLQEGKA
ncbi:bifunctional hydroxymethylpyrimidine kinase/phosphomethylpyrimidine kinase [Lihuaxuella thermophila]|uniref:Hydroxymethylpyrimidine/phosphomethylpyrimidine kinase n=1 Tax=Lihuaxuella thermophila TaxID=1173111 RepID=A0A1H8CW23_9BACL|nr:bifunctional hydroxymethylpyrimidine kinase/phosphomethylpyrimidine kinase [Lihuaxuella thermophila]SEM98654.1 hydroxymethylpyrimidine/phosphomethylpyrimidine kinase [Lihuaxuella thermophila]